MKRLNVILGKKQLVIASLTVLLGAAAAANFIYSSKADKLVSPAAEVSANYGEAEYVSDTSSSQAYFAQARLDKQASRDEAAEVLAGMYQGGDLTVDELNLVADDALKLSSLIESENRIETLLKAQGFEDALCYLSDDTANIIVKTDGLDAQQAAIIKSTLLSEVEVSGEGITIVEVKN
ncbi:MAG: SpoIIIAH-like family protein [Oscillospiraceae bacterium]